jgi:transposase
MSEVIVKTERVDDIPLLVSQQQAMGLDEIIDEVVVCHGNRQGLSVGWTVIGWLSFILSESDHRLSYVEGWVRTHLETLKRVMPGVVRPNDFTDDRLGDVLRILSEDTVWQQIEVRLRERLVQVYELPRETVRVDTTTVSLYHDSEGSVLFRHGHSKDHRSDLAQVKVLLASLDPLALPLVTMVLPGDRADDGLYVPAINQVRETMGPAGLLYVGDSKMEAIATRGQVVAGGDYYLVPLSRKGQPGQLLTELVTQVLAQEQELVSIYTSEQVEQNKVLAQGWESQREQAAILETGEVTWIERLLLIYSPPLAQSGYRGLQQRLQQAEARLTALTPAPGRGKRQARDLAQLQADVDTILSRHRVSDFLQVTYHQEVTEHHIRAYRDKPARIEKTVRYQLTVTRDETAIQTAYQTLGWRLYATNAPADRLSLTEAVQTYRGGVPTIERSMARLKGRPLGLRPVFVHREDHVTGLVRLLSLALRVLTLTEFVVRRSLQVEQDELTGLYPGNPTQATHRPTSTRLLKAFKGITLSFIDLPGQHICHVTPLTPLQNRILQLLRFSDAIYTELTNIQPIPP